VCVCVCVCVGGVCVIFIAGWFLILAYFTYNFNYVTLVHA